MTPLSFTACVYQCMYFCFIGDMFTPENGESEPDWVQTEKQQFSELRDINKVKEQKQNA